MGQPRTNRNSPPVLSWPGRLGTSSVPRMGATPNAKSGKRAGRRAAGDADVVHDRCGRTRPQPVDQRVELIAWALHHAANGPIGHVGDPADEAQPLGLSTHEVPEADAVD